MTDLVPAVQRLLAAITPDRPVWIAAARNGIAFHDLADDRRLTLCGRYVGTYTEVQRGYVQPLAEVLERYGSQLCKACGVVERAAAGRTESGPEVMDVHVQLERARVEQGVSRSELARRARVDRGTVLDLLTTGAGQLHTVLLISRALGLHLYALTPPTGAQFRPCGTLAAARRHYAHGEPLDSLCRTAQRQYDRDRKRRLAISRGAA